MSDYYINLGSLKEEIRSRLLKLILKKSKAFTLDAFEEEEVFTYFKEKEKSNTNSIRFGNSNNINESMTISGNLDEQIEKLFLDNEYCSYEFLDSKNKRILYVGDGSDCLVDFSLISKQYIIENGISIDLFEETVEQAHDIQPVTMAELSELSEVFKTIF